MAPRPFLIDENLPDSLKTWRGPDYENVPRASPAWSDERIWQYARRNRQVLITKDVDFEERVLLLGPPPRVVRFDIGNVRSFELAKLVATVWPTVLKLLGDEDVCFISVDEAGTLDAR